MNYLNEIEKETSAMKNLEKLVIEKKVNLINMHRQAADELEKSMHIENIEVENNFKKKNDKPKTAENEIKKPNWNEEEDKALKAIIIREHKNTTKPKPATYYQDELRGTEAARLVNKYQGKKRDLTFAVYQAITLIEAGLTHVAIGEKIMKKINEESKNIAVDVKKSTAMSDEDFYHLFYSLIDLLHENQYSVISPQDCELGAERLGKINEYKLMRQEFKLRFSEKGKWFDLTTNRIVEKFDDVPYERESA